MHSCTSLGEPDAVGARHGLCIPCVSFGGSPLGPLQSTLARRSRCADLGRELVAGAAARMSCTSAVRRFSLAPACVCALRRVHTGGGRRRGRAHAHRRLDHLDACAQEAARVCAEELTPALCFEASKTSTQTQRMSRTLVDMRWRLRRRRRSGRAQALGCRPHAGHEIVEPAVVRLHTRHGRRPHRHSCAREERTRCTRYTYS